MKKTRLVAVTIFVVLLVSCSNNIAEEPKAPLIDDSSTVEVSLPVLPIKDAVDIESSFSEKNVDLDDSQEKLSLVLDHLDTDSVAKSEQTVEIVSDGIQTMELHCTWDSPARNIYIGFSDTSDQNHYVFNATGGILAGTLNLSSIPDGSYHVIMYSNDNENVVAAMLYQFH